MKTYFALFLIATVSALIITPLIRRLCQRYNLLDVPKDGRRVHKSAVPRLGGIAIFASAYMAEVVRAGLQAIPRGQYEGAMAVGLRYWQMMRLIILPQALKVTIPNIVNTYIGLFKDTTLVFIVGIFDLLRTIEVARIDPKWATPVTSTTGYAVAAIFYLVFCYGMSRYARATEARLAKSDRR